MEPSKFRVLAWFGPRERREMSPCRHHRVHCGGPSSVLPTPFEVSVDAAVCAHEERSRPIPPSFGGCPMQAGPFSRFRRVFLVAAAGVLITSLTACTGRGGGQLPP